MSDKKNLDNTFLRGAQITDGDGVVQFETVFPGHYANRAVHIHLMVHLSSAIRSNGTLMHTTSPHVGQLFFDQSLIDEIRKTAPYSTNGQVMVKNDDDAILKDISATADPFVEYIMLGDTLKDGLLGWLKFGINTTYIHKIQAAATLYKEGGVLNTANPPGPGPLSALFPAGFPTEFEPNFRNGGGPPTGIPGVPPGGPPGGPPNGPPGPSATGPTTAIHP